MKTFAEQVAALKATRAEKDAAMRAVAQKSVDEGRSMDTGESEQFDTLTSEIKRLDGDIERLARLADMDMQTLKAVDDTASRDTPARGGSDRLAVQVKNTQKLEPGIAFARMARVKAVAFTGQAGTRDELQLAKSMYGNDDRLIAALTNKAAVDAANTLNAGWASNLIIDGGGAFADFVEFLRPRTLVGQLSSRLRRLPFDTPVLIQASTGTAKWVKEGLAKPLTEWTYTRTNMKPLKVAAIAAATKEMLMRGSVAVDGLIRDELARAVGATIDTTFIDPAAAGVTDESPASILNGVTPTTLSGGTDYEAVRCDMAILKAAFLAANQSLSGAFWIMSETLASNLSEMVNPLGQTAFPGLTFEGGTIGGIPVIASQYVAADSNGDILALVKGDEIFLGDEGGIQVAMSDQASLQMDNTPTQNSAGTPVATSVVSMWQTNSVAFLVERFINWQRRRLVSVAWGYTNYDACAA
jgi:HK97 family phage major capsid protein